MFAPILAAAFAAFAVPSHVAGASGTKSANDAADVAAALDGLKLAQSSGRLDLEKYRGKIVYVNFFASWCGPCAGEASLVAKLARTYESAGFVVIGIDEGEDAAHVLAFRKRFGVAYPIALDRTGTAEDAFGQTALPFQVFLDRDGNVALSGSGPLVSADASRVIERLLHEPAAT